MLVGTEASSITAPRCTAALATVTPTHSLLVQAGVKFLRKLGCGVLFTEFRSATASGETPDVLGWRTCISFMIEAKMSRSDFLRDFKKPFRLNPERGVGDWRIYICPEGVIKPEDLPEGWALLYWQPKGLPRVICGLPMGNCTWHNTPFKGNKANEMAFMFSALRRVQLTRAGREMSQRT